MPAEPIYDLVGIGFGPSNIALAITLEEQRPGATYLFLERGHVARWQGDMLLRGSDIQNSPLRDLVTPRNPLSPYTFVNYLKQSGRLFDYLNLGLEYPLRRDYAAYIQWAAAQFDDHVAYDSSVEMVELTWSPDERRLLWSVATADGRRRLARALVLAPGRQPRIPDRFGAHLGSRVFHLTEYLRRIGELSLSGAHVAVIGASQSAVEILVDLMARDDDVRVTAIHRSFSFRLKDTSPFSDHVYFPEFVDYFYEASPASRAELERQLRPTNYSSVDGDVLKELYVRLYEERLEGRRRVSLRTNTVVDDVEARGEHVVLRTREVHRGDTDSIEVDAVVLATGFLDLGTGPGRQPHHPLLEHVMPAFVTDQDGAIAVTRDYEVPSLREGAPLLYLNGLCEATHGLGDAGSLSLVSLRAERIAQSALARLASQAELREVDARGASSPAPAVTP
jgi:L-ornithine N5-oxygenase